MDDFFTSDLHFGHRAMLKEDRRNFSSVDEMDEALIKAWNSIVGSKDRVFVVGDLSFRKRKITEEILQTLNGRIFLVRGNHDSGIKGSLLKRFEWDGHYCEMKFEKDQLTVLCHYPFLTWRNSHYGSFHLHGHCHGNLRPELGRDVRRMDVGVDTRSDLRPYSYEEIRGILTPRGYTPIDHHDQRFTPDERD